MEHFAIISALCRASMKQPTPAVINHINKLIKALESEQKLDQAESLRKILNAKALEMEIQPSKVTLSRMFVAGENLLLNTKPPVDKESGSYLADIFFPTKLDLFPIFNDELTSSLSSLLEEWNNVDLLREKNITPALSVMFFGLPGTGKTLLAKYLSYKLGYPLVIAKLDGLLSSFLGTTARNISNLFNFANRYKCILLLDEFDAIAKLRDDPNELGELKRVVNTLLQCLDERAKLGFTIAITNHENLLDPAIWRRFDLRVSIPSPDDIARRQIIISYLGENFELSDTKIEFLVWLTKGYSGSDIEKLILFLKRKIVILGDHFRFLEGIREFIRLNGHMPNLEIGNVILDKDANLAKHLKSDKSYGAAQQSKLAELFETHQPVVSKWLKET